MLAPIVIFGYKRPDNMKVMLDSLKENLLYDESEKYVFVDGPKDASEVEKTKEVIALAKTVTPNVYASDTNKGLGPSVIDGVTSVINRHGKAIVLEDDLLLMPGFLTYMNQALDMYEGDDRMFSVCGYSLKINRPQDYRGDVYLGVRASSWGWGTWADRWNSVDWSVSDFEQLRADKHARRAFNQGGSDMYGMLRDYMDGRNNSWAIRFCYAQFRGGKYSVHPFLSLVDNDGFGAEASNCRQKYSRFRIERNNNTSFVLPADIRPDKSILRQLRWYHSIPLRIYSKIRRMLNV